MEINKLYYLAPSIYVGGVLLLEFFPNIIVIAFHLLSILACIVGLIRILMKPIVLGKKVTLVALLSIPIFNLTFGFDRLIRDKIKGEIVFIATEDSFATSRTITIRDKNGILKGEHDHTFAGLSEVVQADVAIENDSVLLFALKESSQTEKFTIDRRLGYIINAEDQLTYWIVMNEIYK